MLVLGIFGVPLPLAGGIDTRSPVDRGYKEYELRAGSFSILLLAGRHRDREPSREVNRIDATGQAER